MERVDVVVVGGGPAGLAAATWLGRYRRSTLVVDAGEHRNRWTEASHGYLTRDGSNPAELVGEARRQLERYPAVRWRHGHVGAVAPVEDGFLVDAGGDEVTARRLVLATGVRDEFPDVAGFFEHYGADVFHCPACDGFEARAQHVAVFGWGEQVTGFVLDLLDWAASITVVTDGRRLEGDGADHRALRAAEVEVIEDTAHALVGSRGALEGVTLAGGRTLPCAKAFFTIAHHPVTGLATDLGCRLTDEGCVVVDGEGRTSVEGVYAAGDLTPGAQLVQVAAAKGAVAGIACARSLR